MEIKPLDDIVEEYNNLRETFRSFTRSGDGNRDTLIEFQGRFLDLRADLRVWHVKTATESERRNDKNATAIKYRIAASMVRGQYEWNDEIPLYDKSPSISNAEKFAAATQQYKKFLEQRVFYKESLVNITDLREEMASYVNEIKDRLK